MQTTALINEAYMKLRKRDTWESQSHFLGCAATAIRHILIDAARARKARIVLAGMKLPPNYGSDYTRAFEQSYVELARRHKAALVPFLLEGVAERRDLFLPDNIHPVAEAQPLILDNVWNVLRPLLR